MKFFLVPQSSNTEKLRSPKISTPIDSNKLPYLCSPDVSSIQPLEKDLDASTATKLNLLKGKLIVRNSLVKENGSVVSLYRSCYDFFESQ